MSEQKAKLIAGFPGVGKTFLTKPAVSESAHVSSWTLEDLDSTPFSHPDGKPSPLFPGNYIAHIKGQAKDPNAVLLTGVHDVVRDQLVANKIAFTLVYPERELKAEYMERYKARGSPAGLINKLDKEWDNFISSVQGQKECKHVILKEGQFLSDVIEGIVADKE
jgi:hypothetical protein